MQEDRVVVQLTDTVRYKNLSLQIPAGRHRHHYVKAESECARISQTATLRSATASAAWTATE